MKFDVKTIIYLSLIYLPGHRIMHGITIVCKFKELNGGAGAILFMIPMEMLMRCNRTVQSIDLQIHHHYYDIHDEAKKGLKRLR